MAIPGPSRCSIASSASSVAAGFARFALRLAQRRPGYDPFSVAPSAGAWMRVRAAPPPSRRQVTLARGPGLIPDGADVSLEDSLVGECTVLSGGVATTG